MRLLRPVIAYGRAAVVLVYLTGVTPALQLAFARAAATAPSARQSLKEKVASIPAGSKVEVRLRDQTKLSGRLGRLSETGFELQSGKGNKPEAHVIAYDQVKSIQKKSLAHSIARKFLVVGIVLGVIAGGILIGCATHDWCNG